MITYPGSNLLNIDPAFAQLFGNNIIPITSTSSYTDEFGNFHIIGEVNNTSTQPQTSIVITAILSDTTTNSIVGNYSAFSSIETLRQGELSPFDIVIQNPQQILGTFNFMEFATTSQPASVEKPANLVLNGSNSFVDNVGDPHITGNIINLGQFPEQFLNLVAIFYDNSSLGIVGTQSFGLNVGSLANNQMTPFDIAITDNKTKSLAAFYSLNVDSSQSSMSFPLNPKFPFASLEGFVDSGLFLDSPLNVNPLLETGNDFDSNDDQSSSSGSENGNSDSSSSSDDLNVDIDVAKDPISPKNDQTIEVTVSDSDTDERIGGASVESNVHYASGSHVEEKTGQTNNEGIFEHEWEIGGNSKKGTFKVVINVEANGYESQTETTTFKVVYKDDITNSTEDPDNSTEIEENSTTLANDSPDESNGDLDCEDSGETNVPVGDDDPNNLDGDNDGVGCEANNGGDGGQSNNDEEGEGTTNEPSESNPEQTDGDGDGVSNEQPTEEDTDDNGSGSDNEEQDNTENESDENSEEQDDDTGSEETNDDNENNGEEQDDNTENDEN